MVWLSRSRTVSAIGLDFGPRTVRAAQVACQGDCWTLLRASSWSKRDDEAGAPVSEGFTRRVRRSVDQVPFQGRRVSGGLSVPEVEVHPLDIPDAGELQYEHKFGEAVRWEMQRFISYPVNQAAIDFWRIPRGAGTRTTAIGVAAKRSQVDALSRFVDQLGWDCERVDATSCALARFGAVLRRRPGVDGQAAWGMLDIGHRMLRLVVCIGDSPVLVRNLGQGGGAWTEAIASGLGLSVEAAEIHKQDYGIGSAGADSGTEGDDVGDASRASPEIGQMIGNILRTDLAAVVGEIERSYEYVMRCYGERSAGALMLAGGGAQLKHFKSYLKSKLGIEVLRVEDIVSMADSPFQVEGGVRQDLGSFAAAIGLAIEPEAA